MNLLVSLLVNSSLSGLITSILFKDIFFSIDSLLPTVFTEVVTKNDIRPFYQPRINVSKVSDTDLTLVFTITLAPLWCESIFFSNKYPEAI